MSDQPIGPKSDKELYEFFEAAWRNKPAHESIVLLGERLLKLGQRSKGEYDRAFEGCRALIESGEPIPPEKFEAAILAMIDLKQRAEILEKALEFVVNRKNLMFAECSDAEAILDRCNEALAAYRAD